MYDEDNFRYISLICSLP